MSDSFNSRRTLRIGEETYTFYHLAAVERVYPAAARLPYSLRILLENLLRHEDGNTVQVGDIEAVARWEPQAEPQTEIAFRPARVLLQDFTGVPALVDLAAMRDAMARLGGDPAAINPLQPVELVIDHSVQVDYFGTPLALRYNTDLEYQRNRERYIFLRWGQKAFRNFRVVPPETGIVHQVNLEYLARVVFVDVSAQPHPLLYPDTLVGTDSHTTMINGLGVLGWGVGGIEAEAAMLGQPVAMLLPQVVGFRLVGQLREGATATDLVLTVTQMLRQKGVVGKFVEFFGEGLAALSLADRATIANMAPEYGATCGLFPIDEETLRYLRLTGRSAEHIRRIEVYAKEQGLFYSASAPEPVYSEVLHLDLATVEPSLAGPSRPQDRVRLSEMKTRWASVLPELKARAAGRRSAEKTVSVLPGSPAGANASAGRQARQTWDDNGGQGASQPGSAPASAPAGQKTSFSLSDGAVVIAAITSCTNTSNPSVMLAAGLLAKKAVERGLRSRPWVKTSLAPGSKVVTEYLRHSGLLPYLEQLGFHLVGYGCTTCIGNSGPLPAEVSEAIAREQLVVAAVLSGNRNFEGRVHAEVRANFLASPPLVVAYALAGRVDFDPYQEPLGQDAQGRPVYLRELWPSQQEVQELVQRYLQGQLFQQTYREVFTGDERWQALPVPTGDRFAWEEHSTYVKSPPYFEGMQREPEPVRDLRGARVLAYLGDSITTDHISPAGAIKKDSPAGKYLLEHGVPVEEFNSYGARRGNHEVMVRGTFANVRLRNLLVPGLEGGWTRHLPSGQVLTIYEAALRYQQEGVPLLVLAGKEYGSGSSRDWAAKGPRLLGVRAVLAESFERIHRSNLVGMGILPLQFLPGQNATSLGLTGEEVYDLEGLEALFAENFRPGAHIQVRVRAADGRQQSFPVRVRIDTPQEGQYFRHGGILLYVLRQLLASTPAPPL